MTQKPEIDPTESRKGKIYLWLAILIFGAASAVVAKLIMIGENALLDGRNPIAVLQPIVRWERRCWANAIGYLPQRLEAVQTKRTDPQTVAYTAGIGGYVGCASAVADVPCD